MSKYLLLLITLITLLVTWAFSIQSQGGLRFSGNEKLIVSKNSIFRKVLLKKANRDYPLKIYKVIPLAINCVLFCIVMLIYAIYAIFYPTSFGLMIGNFLDSTGVQFFYVTWYLLNSLYIGVINAI